MKTTYRPYLLTITLSLFTLVASAQFGLRTKYNSNSFPGWEEAIPDINHGNIEIGIDYWFKLKNNRVEFMPEIYYGLGKEVEYRINTGQVLNLNHNYIGLQVNTQFYILDFVGDCDCPTFSKEGPSIKKGFFINITPGVVYNTYERSIGVSGVEDPKTNNINLRIGLGAGVDIGITDLLTITPFVNYLLSPYNSAEIFSLENQEITSNWSSLQFGLRLGFRPDYVKRYGYR